MNNNDVQTQAKTDHTFKGRKLINSVERLPKTENNNGLDSKESNI